VGFFQKIIKVLRHELAEIKDFVFNRIEYVHKSMLDNYSVKKIIGTLPNTGDVCLFVHFDKDHLVDAYVVDWLFELAMKYQIVFITNSDKITEEQLVKVKPIVKCVIVRRNVSYDFGAWRDGMKLLAKNNCLSDLSSLLLTNDSNYLTRNLKNCLDRVYRAHEHYEVVGLVDSYQHSYHLQSFFISLSNVALNNKRVREFYLHKIKHQLFKQDIIIKYEIGFSNILFKEQLRYSVLYPYLQLANKRKEEIIMMLSSKDSFFSKDIGKIEKPKLIEEYYQRKLGIPTNPTHDFAIYLLEGGYPLIKCELLIFNPLLIQLKSATAVLADYGDHILLNVNRRVKKKVPLVFWKN